MKKGNLMPKITFVLLTLPPRDVLYTSKDEAYEAAAALTAAGVITVGITIRQQGLSELPPNPNPDGRLPFDIEWIEPVVVRDVAYAVASSVNAGEIYDYVKNYPQSVPWRKILQGDPSVPADSAAYEVDKV